MGKELWLQATIYLGDAQKTRRFRYIRKGIVECNEKRNDRIVDIVKKLEELGYELIFQGGNGDFVDMLLSVDFISGNLTSGCRE